MKKGKQVVYSHACRRRRGAVVVEMAIVLPPLCLLMIGLCVLQLAAYRYHQVAALAHEGARWASVHGKEYARQNNCPKATSQDVLENIIKPKAFGLDLRKLTQTVEWDEQATVVTVTVRYMWTPEALFSPQVFTCTAVALSTY